MKNSLALSLLPLVLFTTAACGSTSTPSQAPGSSATHAAKSGASLGADSFTPSKQVEEFKADADATEDFARVQEDPVEGVTDQMSSDPGTPRDTETRAEIMKQHDADGGIAFATFYFLSLLEASETLDTSTVVELAGPHCQICLADIMAINAAATANFPVDFTSVLPAEAVQATELDTAHYRFDVSMRHVHYSSPGSAPFLTYTIEDGLIGFIEVKHEAEGWQMLDYDAYVHNEDQ